MRPDPAERVALRIVRETDSGVVVRGKIGMHTSPAYAEDVYVGALCGAEYDKQRATFIVPVNAPGVTVICRRISARDTNPFTSPLSSRYDELDGQMWLDDVHIPWDRMFLVDPSPELIARWLFWHQLYCWLSKAEVTLGLALACTHAMGLMKDAATIEYLLDLMTDVQTVRSCQVAAERDPQFTPAGYCYPNVMPSRRRQHRHAEGTPAHERDIAHRARFLAGRRADRSRPCRARDGCRPGGILRRRRLHRVAARGAVADGMGPRLLGTGGA